MSGTLIYSKELNFSKLNYWEISQYFDSEFLIVQIKDYNGGYSASMGKLWTIPFIPGFGDTRYNYQEISEGFNLIQSPGVSEQWKIAIQPFAKVVTLRIQLYEVSNMPIFRGGTTQVTVNTPTSASVAASSVNASTASVQLLAANANRKSASITNNSTATLYIELGATASSTAYTIALGQNDYFELPIAYTGVIVGIWTAANGNALVREYV